jgi:thiamine biosynthesis protein ThiC
MEFARKGIITPQMKHIHQTEQVDESQICENVATGKIVIQSLRHR